MSKLSEIMSKKNALMFSESLRNVFRAPAERKPVEGILEEEDFDHYIFEILSAMLLITQDASDRKDLTMQEFVYLCAQIYYKFNQEAADERKHEDPAEGIDREAADIPGEPG